MSRRWTISEQDAHLFREKVGAVRPVKHDKVVPARQPPPPRARFRRADNVDVLNESLGDSLDPADFGAGGHLFFSQPGVDKRIVKRLKRGQIAIGAECDLHGLTIAQARDEVRLFLGECRELGIHCARIIHGKGLRSGNKGPVLKRELSYWLVQRADVLAFCSAQPADGGTGAAYILLRHR